MLCWIYRPSIVRWLFGATQIRETTQGLFGQKYHDQPLVASPESKIFGFFTMETTFGKHRSIKISSSKIIEIIWFAKAFLRKNFLVTSQFHLSLDLRKFSVLKHYKIKWIKDNKKLDRFWYRYFSNTFLL